MSFERLLRWSLVSIAVAGLAAGIIAYVAGQIRLADLCWTLATAPVVAGLAVSIVRDFLAGRFGVDAVALVSMSAAIALGQPLAGAVVAVWSKYWSDASISSIANLSALITVPVPHRRPG